MRLLTFCLIAVVFTAQAAFCALTLPLSEAANGSDGDLSVPEWTTKTIDLSQAVTGTWDQPGNGKGVYDPLRWVVVFKYNSVNLVHTTRSVVNFTPHPSGAPVVWIIKNNATLNGIIYVNGSNGHRDSPGSQAKGGPGGFRGGIGTTGSVLGSGGYGPGGASLGTSSSNYGGAGSYATLGDGATPKGPVYGNSSIIPLIGGSGGSGARNNYHGGGGGGGAILIVCANTIDFWGTINANGGGIDFDAGGPGSGGAIRIVADVLRGGGNLAAMGGYTRYIGSGGQGRIRIEANDTTNFTSASTPPYSYATPGTTPTLFPDDTMPAITSITLGGVAVPTDPNAQLTYPHADVSFETAGTKTLVIQAKNVPVDGTWKISVRCVAKQGADTTVEAAYVSGDINLSNWEATVSVGQGFSAVQARAYKL